MNKLLLLIGTPASGKDTITRCLMDLNVGFSYFKKHKLSLHDKKDEKYFYVNEKKFEEMINKNIFIQHNARYGNKYGVSVFEMEKLWKENLTPIVHVGSYGDIKYFDSLENIEITSVLLLVSEKETLQRLLQRHPQNHAEVISRMKVYHQQRREIDCNLYTSNNPSLNLAIQSSNLSPERVAILISDLVFA